MGKGAVCLHTEITFSQVVRQLRKKAPESPRSTEFTYLPSGNLRRFSPVFATLTRSRAENTYISSHSAGITLTPYGTPAWRIQNARATLTAVKRITRRETNPDVLLYAIPLSIHRRMIPHRQLKSGYGVREFYERAFEDCRLVYNRLRALERCRRTSRYGNSCAGGDREVHRGGAVANSSTGILDASRSCAPS